MHSSPIAHRRLHHQQLLGSTFTAPADIVRWLGAVQAQDLPMSKWAVGARLPGCTEAMVDDALNRAEIVRVHILRPTWHLVAAEDLRWLLALTAPHVKAAMAATDRQLGLDDRTVGRSQEAIAAALAGGNHLTRPELMAELTRAGLATHDNRPAHLMYRAELDGLVCNGGLRGRHHTYALVAERIGPTPLLPREEAREALARRYFRSHGPATLADFAWWSGLPMADVRAALADLQPELVSETLDGQTYWQSADAPPAPPADSLHLLPCFDEFTVSYKDRRASVDPAHAPHVMTANGIFKPIVVVNGRVVGSWKREITRQGVRLTVQLLTDSPAVDPVRLQAAAARYAEFLGMAQAEVAVLNHG